MLVVAAIAMGTTGMLAAGWAVKRYRHARMATLSAPAVQASPGAETVGGPGTSPLPGLLKDVLQGGQAGLVGAGLALSAATGEVVKRLGGSEAEQNIARLNALQAGAPIALSLAVEKGLGAIGVGGTASKDVGQAVAVGVFAAPLLPLFGTVKVGQKLAAVFGSDTPEPPAIPYGQLFSPGELAQFARSPLRLVAAGLERRKTLDLVHNTPGTHVVRVRVSGEELWGEPPFFRLMVNGKTVTLDLPAVGWKSRDQWQEHFLRVTLDPSVAPETIAIAFPNGGYSPSEGYRKLWMSWLEIEGSRYLAEQAMYYREGMDPIPGQPELAQTGVLIWFLRPEHRDSVRARRVRLTAEESAAAVNSTRFV